MSVFWAIGQQQQNAGCRNVLSQAIENRLSFGIGPVQIFEDQQQRLSRAFLQKDLLDRINGVPSPLRRVESGP